MKTSTKQLLGAGVALLLVIGALVGVKAAQIGAMIKDGESFQMPAEAVTVADVEAGKWQPELNAVGTVVALHQVTLAAELGGTVQRIQFESGDVVKKGAVLVKLDTSIEETELASARSEAKLAEISVGRSRKLREVNATTQAETDTSEARATQAAARVANIEATIAKKTIRAPFDGQLGIREVELGQVMGLGTPIVTLSSLSPVYAEFYLPQQTVAQLSLEQKVRLTSDSFEGETFDGKIAVIDPVIDASTRNVRVRALFQTEDRRLRPGMFVNVAVLPEAQKDVLTIPSSAILYAPYGDSVFVVEEGKTPPAAAGAAPAAPKADAGPVLTVKQTFVRLGDKRGDLVNVISGLEAGQRVVSTGAFKLRNGGTVTIQNELAPKAELDPQTENK